MAKSVDAADLKSASRKAMPVRVRLRAPHDRVSTSQAIAGNDQKPRHDGVFCCLTSPGVPLQPVKRGGRSYNRASTFPVSAMMFRRLCFAVLISVSATGAFAAAKAVKTTPGSVTGVVSYAAGQYWINSGKETICVMVDPVDEPTLQELIDSRISFKGPIQTWPDKRRCVVVGPDFPTPIE